MGVKGLKSFQGWYFECYSSVYSLWQRTDARNISFKSSLRWPIYIINSFDKTGLSWSTPDWRSTTEICPLLNGSLSWSWTHIHSNYIFQSQYQWIGSLNHKYKLSKYCTVSNQELFLISGSKSNSWPRIRSHYPSKHRRRHHRTEEKSWRTKTRGTIPIHLDSRCGTMYLTC